jgi:hypothetical protein
MDHDLTAQQHLLLKQLLAAGGPTAQKDLKRPPKPAEQSALIDAGLITRQKLGRSFALALADAGRSWITDHPEYVLPPKPFPKTNQRLFLLQLAFLGGTAAGRELRPALSPAERKALSSEKLLQSDKGPRGSLVFTLTDAGWKWAEDHLGDPVNTAGVTGAAAATLQRVLLKVGSFLAAGNLRLADLIRTKAPPTPAPPGEPASPLRSEIEKAIEAACLRLGQGRDRQRLRLADLRQELDQWDRRAQDTALLELARSGCLVLYGMDDPKEIGADDRGAEFSTPSGEVRHLVYWIGRRTTATK